MENAEKIKQVVREKYSEIALQDKATNESSCCGASCCSSEVYNIMSDDYATLKGYNPDADLGLGCGLPTQFAKIKKGDVVVDLGSGAGNDCFVARAETGETGKVIGIDMTEAMINRARINAEKLGFHNVEFRLGEIEKMPLTSNVADVVVSNCVLNLVPDKQKAFAEIHRVLKPGGHFSISDIVLTGTLPEKILKTAELYAGCVAGAIQKEEYLGIIRSLGFQNITVQKEKVITVPVDILSNYLTPEEIALYQQSGVGIFSITVYAEEERGRLLRQNNLLQLMKNILFVCVENSNRSQMAQAFALLHGKGRVNAYSAGSKPSGLINQKAIAAMKELGYDLTTHQSKSLAEIPDVEFEYVITMGCGDACPHVPARHREDWAIPDPRDMNENEFRKVRNIIEAEVISILKELH